MNNNNIETERKFLIKMPDAAVLEKNALSCEQIRQTYLKCGDPDSSSRVRRSICGGTVTYTATEKRRLSDMTRIEHEREISRKEYEKLLENADPTLRVIEKTRRKLPCGELVAEVDVYPFWHDRAILETELEHEDQAVSLPEYITLIREVTLERRYTNRAIAAEIPYEEL